MHVAAAHPLALTAEELPAALIERERSIAMEKAKESGKPQNIVEKMVEGGLAKFRKENALTHPAVRDGQQDPGCRGRRRRPRRKPARLSRSIGFVRFQLGEGIEKKESDFAAEVAAAAGTSKPEPVA